MNLNEYPLWTALVTPMNEDGSIDFPSIEKLLKTQEEAQNGVLLLGSTGESLNLNLAEKKSILDFALKLNLNIPFMVGVGGINLQSTSSWVEYLNTIKVDAYLMVTPLYAKPGPEGQYHWFKTLMDLSDRPVMLYNIPSRSGCPLNFDALKRLNDHPKLWAVKEASGSIIEFKRYIETASNAKIFSGDDAMMPAFANFGASGLVSVASNIWPKQTNEYVRQSIDKSLEDSELWKECSDSLFITSNPVPAKALLHHLGIISSPVTRPPLSHKDLRDISILKTSNKCINDWHKDQK